MQIGFTGSQFGLSSPQQSIIRAYIQNHPQISAAHHGDCVSADAEFHELCSAAGIPVTLHPPSNKTKRAFCRATFSRPPRPYLERNQQIVEACVLLIAGPSGPEKLRSGTWATVRYARRQNRPLLIVWPNGESQLENSTHEDVGLSAA